MANRLASEPSPYLRQHAENPVDWWPWGEEAFAEAARRDVPGFLSVGYATCHWCHVMAHESFEDEAVAALLNEAFVCVKVDREERPDVDDAYMAVCQAMTGRGGWPLTVLLTPDKRPWFAGTYFPKASRGHHLGMLDLVPRLQTAWTEKREQLVHQAGHVLEHVAPPTTQGQAPSWQWSQAAFDALSARFDAEHGGFGGAPKFPSPHTLLWLLSHHDRTGDARALDMVRRTLDAMAAGGVHDHVGGGFHRYSTDERWFLPHFEKMLYDQATLLRAYAAAYAATGDARYARVASGIVAYLERDLRHPEGGLYSAEDADAEGEEGKFTVWSAQELRDLLGEKAEAFMEAHGARPDGNFHDEATGQPMPDNILHLPDGYPGDDPWRAQREVLLRARDERVRPLLDDKVLTDWNGLAVGALADAAVATGDASWLHLAEQAAGFVLDRLRTPDGALLHRWHDGRVDDRAFLDDHAFLGDGLLRLFEATQDARWLEAAVRVAEDLLGFEADGGGFRISRDDDVPVSRVEAYDGALPSGNAVAANLLWRVGRITGDDRFEAAAERTVQRFSAQAATHPAAFTALLETVEAMLGGGREVVVAGAGPEAEAMLHAARAHRVAGQVVLHATPEVAAIAPWVAEYPAGPDAPARAYVCRDRACRAPVDSTEALRSALTGKD